jgi:hypothetical protein
MDRQFFADIAGGIGGLVGGDQHRTAALAKLLLEGDFSGAASQAGDNAQSSLNKTLAALLSNDPKQVAEYAPNLLGITAFHGTPHKFDKFSMDKIGTGEGAQAFGHGLYFAGNPKVAEEYQKVLSHQYMGSDLSGVGIAKRLMDGGDVSKDSAIKELKRRKAVSNDPEFKKRMDEGIQWVESGGKPGGALYKADIPDDHELLDWDAPLSEQPESVRKAIQGIIDDLPTEMRWMGDSIDNDSLGMSLYGAMADISGELNPDMGSTQEAASYLLKKAGVTGLRYKDGMSRGKEGGTHNYVIWDENRIGTPQAVE